MDEEKENDLITRTLFLARQISEWCLVDYDKPLEHKNHVICPMTWFYKTCRAKSRQEQEFVDSILKGLFHRRAWQICETFRSTRWLLTVDGKDLLTSAFVDNISEHEKNRLFMRAWADIILEPAYEKILDEKGKHLMRTNSKTGENFEVQAVDGEVQEERCFKASELAMYVTNEEMAELRQLFEAKIIEEREKMKAARAAYYQQNKEKFAEQRRAKNKAAGKLTPSERRQLIRDMVSAGKTEQQIIDELGISKTTFWRATK